LPDGTFTSTVASPTAAFQRRRYAAEGNLYFLHAAERFLAVCGVLVTAPLLIALALVTVILSGRSPFIRHIRVGWRGRTLAMWKLRTMWDANSPGTTLQLVETVDGRVPEAKGAGDHRVASSFSAFCRRHSLDELPQLIHVVLGDMSLVGPRPITSAELEEHYTGSIDEVLSVKPGITGLWQVMGRNRLTYAQRRRLDLFLVRRGGPGLYLRVLLQAIPVMLSADGAF
jgi:lipopolysaccharide/colanic/teichoic acid biosynthesis glycosyltransferase